MAARGKGRKRRGKPHKSLSHGAGATEIPDFKNIADPNPTLYDAYDDKFFRSIIRPPKPDKLEELFDQKVSEIAKIDSELSSVLSKLDSIFQKGKKVLTEIDES